MFWCREAESVLEKVQKQIGEPQQAFEAQVEAVVTVLSNHTHHLQEAQELIATAKEQSNQTTQLLSIISVTLDQYTVSPWPTLTGKDITVKVTISQFFAI